MLDFGKSGNTLSRYPKVPAKLRSGDSGNLLAAIEPSWASIYCRCVTGSSIRLERNGTKIFSGSNILNECGRADPAPPPRSEGPRSQTG